MIRCWYGAVWRDLWVEAVWLVKGCKGSGAHFDLKTNIYV